MTLKACKRAITSVAWELGALVFRCPLITWLFGRDPKIIEQIFVQHRSVRNSSLCLFASFSPKLNLPNYVTYNLRYLRRAGFDVIFVYAGCKLSDQSLELLKKLCIQIIYRKNIGYDFGSWKAGLLYSGIEWQKYKKILFANDSCYAPLYPMDKILQQGGNGVVSITDSLEQEPHLMSYFLLCHQDVISHPDFLRFWQNVRMVPNRLKGLIVQLYEIGFSRYFRKRGFSLRAAYPVAEIGRELGLSECELRKINPMHQFWRYLIETKKCPVLKVDLFKRRFIKDEDTSWKETIQKTEYPLELILQHQRHGS